MTACPETISQQDTALTIIETLQASGLRNVMVYDDLGQLRIQAFGDAAARVVLDH